MNPLQQQFNLVHDCIRACVYCEHIHKQNTTSGAWLSLKGMCYSDAINTWNQLFGVWSQDTHWKKFVSILETDNYKGFDFFTKEKILDSLKISESQWSTFHQSMIDVRNTRIAHLNFSKKLDSLPNLEWVLLSACFYREWLVQTWKQGNGNSKSVNTEEQNTNLLVKKFYEQIRSAYDGIQEH
jgi:hypothetical protein